MKIQFQKKVSNYSPRVLSYPGTLQEPQDVANHLQEH